MRRFFNRQLGYRRSGLDTGGRQRKHDESGLPEPVLDQYADVLVGEG